MVMSEDDLNYGAREILTHEAAHVHAGHSLDIVLADAVDVSHQTINAIEKGHFVPSTVLALKIALHFNKKVDDIFILDDED